MSNKYDKAVNSFRLACGTASQCQSCQALMAYGVNDTRTMAAVASLMGHPVYGQGYIKWLRAHEEYHKRRGDELPDEWTERGLSDEFKAHLMPLPPKKPAFVRPVKPVFIRKDSNMEKAHKAFQKNGRTRPEPVEHLNTAPFAGW